MAGARHIDSQRTAHLVVSAAVAIAACMITALLLLSSCGRAQRPDPEPQCSVESVAVEQSALRSASGEGYFTAAGTDRAGSTEAFSGDGSQAVKSSDAQEIELCFGHGEANVPFRAQGMLPGDSVTQGYQVVVSYKGDAVLHFGATVRDGSEKLAEVMRMRVEAPGGTCLYEGLMRSAIDVSAKLPSASQPSEAARSYLITAWLDTSVGNEYQNKKLVADFGWWVTGGELVQTGDQSAKALAVSCAVAVAAAAMLLVAYRKRRKEVKERV